MGPQDVVYSVLILACIKTGYKLLLNSPRNSLEAHLSLFEKMGCDTFLMPPSFPLPVVKQILAARKMRVLEIPGIQHWTQDGPDTPYPYTKTFKEAKYEPFVVLHTSGSTGLPKPIIQTHATWTPQAAYAALPQPVYPAMCAGKRVYNTFPLFHCAGIAMLLPGAIYAGFTSVLGPFPPSADTVNSVLTYGNVQHCCAAPMTLIELAKDPIYLQNLSRLEQLTFGGGACPQGVGDLISTKTRLLNCLGTTECGVLPIELSDPADWAYMKVNPVLGHEYRHVTKDLYEQVIVRKPELEQYQGIFGTFPELDEWPMKDLYSKHPNKENTWLYRGRSDDIIVYSTGEKLNPLDMEDTISSDPAVSAVLLTGHGRFQSSLLIEAVKPPMNDEGRDNLLTKIWPSIEAANSRSPTHGRIHRNMILFTSPEKPMLRAGKGTVQRKVTLDSYSAEIDALYAASDVPTNGSSHSNLTIEEAVKSWISDASDIEVRDVPHEANLFDLGLDSLQVTAICRSINQFLSARGLPQVAQPRTVYSNPSIAALAKVVSTLAEGKALPSAESAQAKMQRLYETFTASLPISGRSPEPTTGDIVVMLTGSTGSLGSYTLDVLLHEPSVSKIYCLGRGPDLPSRQKSSQETKGLRPLPPGDDKVVFLEADLAKPYFGLPAQSYKALILDVTVVVHLAWKVNFNLSLDSFADHVATVRRLVDLSAHSRRGTRLFFASSPGAIKNYRLQLQPPSGSVVDGSGLRGSDGTAAPERIYEDWRTPQATGYAQSKFVAERILDAAARESGVPAVVCRIGQIAGPTTPQAGVWPSHEWVPSLVASARSLRRLPDSLGIKDTIEWLPVDVVARCLVELVVSSSRGSIGDTDGAGDSAMSGATETDEEEAGVNGATVFHIENPQRTTWARLLPTIARRLQETSEAEGPLEIVPLYDWVRGLREASSSVPGSGEEEEALKMNPAIKLLDFFEELAEKGGQQVLMDTAGAVAGSPTLAAAAAVGDEWLGIWMRQWGY
ncbi:hypothetical protein F4778DRAFT_745468 [Xylariomycetidae sp. FL2044]|nr:hypothetical protein F4778DRAFT_745468 [Xylariomycetidae sp. FL2044]